MTMQSRGKKKKGQEKQSSIPPFKRSVRLKEKRQERKKEKANVS